jgi:hypothetical protein
MCFSNLRYGTCDAGVPEFLKRMAAVVRNRTASRCSKGIEPFL